jgi:superfamily II DNA or RNA helicase
MTEYAIVFSIQPFEIGDVNFYFPSACIATMKANVPQYYYKKVTQEILLSIGIQVDQNTSYLLKICEENTIESIENRLNKPKKKWKNIIDLFQDDEIRKIILNRLNRDIGTFLSKISYHKGYNLYYNLQRKIYLPDIAIKLPIIDFEIKIVLHKTALGMNYIQKLILECQEILPSEVNILVINDSPCYITINNQLYYNPNISGKRIEPFLKKKEIFVPQRTIPLYFNRFIRDMVSKVGVEPHGFEFESRDDYPLMKLKFSENLITSFLELSVMFVYGEVIFNIEDQAKNKVLIEIDQDDQPRVYKVNRNLVAEQNLLQSVIELGFDQNESKRLILTAGKDPFDIVRHVVTVKSDLEMMGVQLLPFKISDNILCLEPASLDVKYSLQGDWFDIKAKLLIGEFEIPFVKLMQHIKNENRYFILPNEEVFIIPLEWMNKYSMLAKLTKVEGSRILLSKANFPLLEGIKEDNEIKTDLLQEKLKVDLPIGLKAELRPYQKEGALWLIDHYTKGLGACLADDMGLGKTLQTIALLQYVKENHISTATIKNSSAVQLSLFDDYAHYRNSLRSLVVLPSSLIFNWESELRKFAPQLMIKRHVGYGRTTKFQDLENFDVILTTYQTAYRDEKLMMKIDFRMIILDESHYIKNKDTKIFQALSRLKSYQRISLSGTPIENSLSDLWSQMQFINPNILGEFKFFNTHFKQPIEKEKNQLRVEELKTLVNPFLLRRTKSEVLKDLPTMEEQIIYSEMEDDQNKLYESEKSVVRNQILDDLSVNVQYNKINILNALMRLRQISNHPSLVGLTEPSSKYNDVISTISSLLKAGHSILIFSSFVKHLEIYEGYFHSESIHYAKLTGELDEESRGNQVRKFMDEDDCKVFLMSIKAGGVGLNLTKASYVIILDPWWNPFVEKQAIARAHRLGQENKVTVLRFITRGTIEEKIIHLQVNKLQLAAEFMDVGEFPVLDEDNVRYLID